MSMFPQGTFERLVFVQRIPREQIANLSGFPRMRLFSPQNPCFKVMGYEDGMQVELSVKDCEHFALIGFWSH